MIDSCFGGETIFPNYAPKILVVDDEPIHSRFVRAVLAPAGWEVDSAMDGAAGVAAILKGGHALILMTVRMPELNGIDATIQVRAKGGAAAVVPILAFTTVRQPEVLAEMLARFRAAGMDGHLPKPCTPEALHAAVAPWWPLEEHPGDRLAKVFGATAIADLLASFRANLATVLETLDEDYGRHERAHRMAGLAGTLGFQEVSAACLALSEGDESALEPCKIAARKTLLLLDRDLESGRRTRR